MSKKIEILCVILVSIAAAANIGFTVTTVVAAEPQVVGKYYIQVPHVVLPETIQYKHFNDRQESGGSVNVSQYPATYTAFPSYSIPESTDFRTISQIYYPVTPTDQVHTASANTASIGADHQFVPQQGSLADLTNVPKFEIPLESVVQPEAEPVYLTKLNETPNPIRQVSDSTISEPANDVAPANSIVFLKSQHSEPTDSVFDDDFTPSPLNLTTSNHLNWLDRESLFVRPITYNEVAPPTQLGFMQPNTGFQQAQPLSAYGQLCQQNYNYNNSQPQYQQQYGATSMPHPSYTAATGLNSAWGAYLGAASQQQMMPAQPQSYQSLTQLGGMMPVMSGQPMSPAMTMQSYGMPMQQPMQPAIQQQTIGYILLYPQAAQSGVNMQLVGKQDQGDDESASTAEGNDAANPNIPNWNNTQLQATFIPTSQIPNYAGQPAMSQMSIPNPMMTGGMNPYMMNPMMMGGMNPMMMGGMNPYMMNPMMGGMNPYMMNPMMMGMGGMMPPIIIQMPVADSGRRRGGGLFARIRAARQETQGSPQQASNSLSSLFSQPSQMPAKAAYPYGYFGATSSPYQSAGFGGYHDMSTQTVRYPGM